ncbi:MAG: hypothetical protein PHV21_05695, partial [Synergistaceae bacterium]|nr:hypothetical protein [Synergistaceae bacterium]
SMIPASLSSIPQIRPSKSERVINRMSYQLPVYFSLAERSPSLGRIPGGTAVLFAQGFRA